MTYLTIAVIGGTGPQGKGLGYRFARAGHAVVVGSRSAERAEEVASQIRERGVPGEVSGAANAEAAAGADLVLLAVPYDGHDALVADLAEELAGKVVVSCVNPLGFDKQGPFGLDVPGGSAAETAAALVPDARVVGAFHHVSAVTLWGERSTSTTRTCWSAATTRRPRRSSWTSRAASPRATASTPAGSGSPVSWSLGPPC